MGNWLWKRSSIVPEGKLRLDNSKGNLKDCNFQASRSSLKFQQMIGVRGVDNEQQIWLGCNIWNNKQKFLIKKVNKYKLFNNDRIQCLKRELEILKDCELECIIQTYYAFQDYQCVYVVCDAKNYISLQQLLAIDHAFTQEETQYIIITLITIIQYVHSFGYAITQLSPDNILIDKDTGQIQVFQFGNTARIDQFYPSNCVSQVCSYSAPEILYRDKVLAECDYYSLGVIMHKIMIQKKVDLHEEEKPRSRLELLKEVIEVSTADLPEGWKPQAVDFLSKLLIKNPSLRLGRFGSYEVKNHPWLHNYSKNSYSNQSKIHMNKADIVEKSKIIKSIQPVSQEKQPEIMKSYSFQQLFHQFQYMRNVEESVELEEENIKWKEADLEPSNEDMSSKIQESNIKLRTKFM